MIDPSIGVKTDVIQWFNNGVWKEMPHRYFFTNNLNEHFKHNNKHMPIVQRKVWTLLYRSYLLKHQAITLNHISFRVQPTTIIEASK